MRYYIVYTLVKSVIVYLALALVIAGCVPIEQENLEVSPITNDTDLQILINIIDDGDLISFESDSKTIGRVLVDANLDIYAGDDVEPPLDTLVYSGITINIKRSRPILIDVDGRAISFRTYHEKVADILMEAGIVLVGRDYSEPSLSSIAKGDIEVVRVFDEYRIEYEPVPFDKQWIGLPDLEIDRTRVHQSGKSGVLARRLRVRRAISMLATSYSPSRAGTPVTAPWYGKTRSGKVLKKGMVAIDTRYIPLGSTMYIPGYGFAVAEDTGSGIRGLMVDLGYEDHNYRSWRSYVTVYLRMPVPPLDQIVWILP